MINRNFQSCKLSGIDEIMQTEVAEGCYKYISPVSNTVILCMVVLYLCVNSRPC